MPLPAQVDFNAWQQHLDFLLPRREMLRADEVAGAVGLDERTVHRLFEDAQLPGHEFNAASGARQHRRYRRAGVVLLLAKRANYAPTDLRDRVLEVITTLPRAEKALLHQALGQLLRA